MLTKTAVEAFLLSCSARSLSPRTIGFYSEKLGKFKYRHRQLPKKPEDIEMFMAGLTCSAETKHGYYRALRAFYRFAADRYGVPNPIDMVKPPRRRKKVMRTLDLNELRALFRQPLSERDQTLLTLLLDTGLRAGEVANLTWDDIQTCILTVRGKSGQREVPISSQTLGMLLASRNGHVDGHIFRGKRGPLTTEGIYKIVRGAFKGAGLDSRPRSSPHTMRHTFGRQYISSGGDLFSLQRIMGHADISTTKKYVELDNRDTIRQHRRFTPLKLIQCNAQKGRNDDRMC